MQNSPKGELTFLHILVVSVLVTLVLAGFASSRETSAQDPTLQTGIIVQENPDLLCSEPMAMMNIFPPYNSPLGAPIIPNSTNSPTISCRHDSFSFCRAFKKLNPTVKCNILRFGDGDYRHAANSYEFKDSNGQRWVCFLEPQIKDPNTLKYTEHYCVKAEAIENYGGLSKWIREVLCKQYYGFPELQCLSGDVLYNQICAQMYGQTCDFTQVGQETACVLNPGPAQEFAPFTMNKLTCKCSIVGFSPGGDSMKRCFWQ